MPRITPSSHPSLWAASCYVADRMTRLSLSTDCRAQEAMNCGSLEVPYARIVDLRIADVALALLPLWDFRRFVAGGVNDRMQIRSRNEWLNTADQVITSFYGFNHTPVQKESVNA